MSVNFQKFLIEVMPYVRDVPEFVAINAIRNATIEFCEKTKIIQQELDPITLLPGISTYDLDVGVGYQPAGVMAAWVSNQPLEAKAPDDLKKIYPQDWRVMTGNPSFFTQMVNEEVIVVPFSTEKRPNALRLITAVTPARDASSVDDLVWNKYAEIIGFGARARLYDTPGQPYYDPQAAVLYRAKFVNGIGEGKIAVGRGLSRASNRVRPPRLV